MNVIINIVLLLGVRISPISAHATINRCSSSIFKGIVEDNGTLQEHMYTSRDFSQFLTNLPPDVAADINVSSKVSIYHFMKSRYIYATGSSR